jgi:hypothetical protein
MLFSLKLLPSRYINHFWQENRQHSIRIPVDVENAVHALWYQRQCQKKGWLTTPSVLLNMVCYEDSECWDPRGRCSLSQKHFFRMFQQVIFLSKYVFSGKH